MHKTVFKQLAIDYLEVKPQRWYLDGTFGVGGHSGEILARGGNVLAFDYDEEAILAGHQKFKDTIAAGQMILVRENFDQIQKITDDLQKKGAVGEIRGILFDFGTSTDQLLQSEVGLSFNHYAPLDMRLDTRLGVTAADLLMVLSEKQLADIFYHYGGELENRQIAKAIVKQRAKYGARAFQTTGDLTSLVNTTKKAMPTRLHPATKVFQALRIVVNDELGNLERVLPQAWQILNSGDRLVTIAFHEGEDRPVKQFMQAKAQNNEGILISKKPIMPDTEELKNPRARSAKLRAIEKR